MAITIESLKQVRTKLADIDRNMAKLFARTDITEENMKKLAVELKTGMEAVIQEYRKATADFEEKAKEFEKEAKNLDGLQTRAKLTAENKELNEKLQKLLEEKTALEGELAGLRSSFEEISKKLEGLNVGEQISPELLEQLKTLAGAGLAVGMSQEQFSELMNKFTSLQESIANLPTGKDGSDVAVLREEIVKLNSTMQTLKSSDPEALAAARQKISELEAKYASYVSPEEFAKYSGRADITPEALAALQKELENEKAKVAAGGGDPARVAELEELLKKQTVEERKRRGVIYRERNQLADTLEEQTKQFNQTELTRVAEIGALKKENSDLGAQISTYKERVSGLEADLEEARKNGNSEEVAKLQAELDRYRASNVYSDEELEKLKGEQYATGYDAASGDLDAKTEENKKLKKYNKKLGTALIVTGGVGLALALGLGLGLGIPLANANKTIGELEGYFDKATAGQGIIIQIMAGETPDEEAKTLFVNSIQEMKENKNEKVKGLGTSLENLLKLAEQIGNSQPGDKSNVKAYLDFIYQIEQMKTVYSNAIADGTVSEEEKAQLNAQISLLNSAEATAITQYNMDSKDNMMIQNKSGEVIAMTFGEQKGVTIGSVFGTAANYYNLKKEYDDLASSGNITPDQLAEKIKGVKEKYVGLMFDVSNNLTTLISKANAEGFAGFTEDDLAILKNLSSYTDEIKADYQAKYGESADFATSFGTIVDAVGALANADATKGVEISEYSNYLDKISSALAGLYDVDESGKVTLKPVYTLDEDGNVVDSANELVEALKSFEANLQKVTTKGIGSKLEDIRKGAKELQQTADSKNITPEQLAQKEKEIKDKYLELMYDVRGKLNLLFEKANAEGFQGFSESDLNALKDLSKYTDEIKADYQAKYGKLEDFVDFNVDFGTIVDAIGSIANTKVNLTTDVANKDTEIANKNITIQEYSDYLTKISNALASLYENDGNGNLTLKQVYALDEDGNVVNIANKLVDELKSYEEKLENIASKNFGAEFENIRNGISKLQQKQDEYVKAVEQIENSIKELKTAVEDGVITEAEANALKEKYKTAINEIATEYVSNFLDVVENASKLDDKTKADLLDYANSKTFIHALFDSQIGIDPTGMTEAEIRQAIADQLGLIYDELGGENEGEKDEAKQPGNN